MFTKTIKPTDNPRSINNQSAAGSPLAVIDIGSNSVRIRISDGQNVLYRETITTQLSKDINDGMLAYSSVNRTLDGLSQLFSVAEKFKAEVHAFATAAVRNSKNGKDFTKLVRDKFGVEIDVVSGEKESELGIIGALGSADGIVLDVGGASSEIAVQQSGNIVYKHSLPLGAVTLTDLTTGAATCSAPDDLTISAAPDGLTICDCAKNYEKSAGIVKRMIEEYGKVPCGSTLYLIGGTATSLAFMLYGDREYDREKNHGRIIYRDRLEELTRKLFVLDKQDIITEYRIKPKRADIIHSGAVIILSVMEYLGKTSAVVSENDNLEGYAKFYEKQA